MTFLRPFTKLSRQLATCLQPKRAQLKVESLESRLVPYSLSGNAWENPELVTLSFMPDGTNLGGVTSNLHATMDARWAPSVWQREILRAAQVWAQVTNLNFALVNDSGAASGSGAYQQGDPNFGDIRIGAYSSGGSNLGSALMPPPANNYSVAGDFTLNSSQPWVINQTGGYDLFTVAAHEIGHTLGLYHSTVSSAEEYSFYNAIKSSLRPDDIAGIRAIYSAGLGRAPDLYDAVLSNGSFLTATDLTATVNPLTLTALVENLDLTTTSDKDYFSVLAPLGTNGTVTVNVQSAGLSMLMPTVTVYNAWQQQVGFASGAGQYGSTLSVTVNGVSPLEPLYVKVAPAETTAFGTGKYALSLNFGTGDSPTVPLPDTQVANGSPLRGGGGIATRDGTEELVNQTTAGAQQTYSEIASRNAVAMNSWGAYVVTWSSQDQDGDGSGVYARMYGPDGVAWTDEFQVNDSTVGDQLHAAASLDDEGFFTIAWVSQGQDADGSSGIYAKQFFYGIPLGLEFAVADGLGEQTAPTIATDALGNFAIAWTSADDDGTGIFARRYAVSGLPLGAEFQVNTATTGAQTQPALAVSMAGQVAVVWTGQDPETGSNVFAKLYDTNGEVLHEEQLVNTATAGAQEYPAVAMADDGDYFVTWSSYGQDGSGWGVYSQRFTNDGSPRDAEQRVNSNVGGDQWYSAIASLADGQTVITWTALEPDGTSAGIFAQQYSAAGDPVGAEIQVNTTVGGQQSSQAVGASAHDGFAVVWNGEGVGDADGVFVQRYQIEGGGGGAGAEDDFYGISDHGGGCGCSSCLAAVLAPGAASEGLPLGADGAVLATLLAGKSDATSSHAPGGEGVAPNAAPPSAVGVGSRQLSPGSEASRVIHDAPASAAELPGPIAVESEEVESLPASSTVEPPPPPLDLVAAAWTQALDELFVDQAEEATLANSANPAAEENEPVTWGEAPTPLASLGVVLGGLWALRPVPSAKREEQTTCPRSS